MGRTGLNRRKKLVCPACRASVRLRAELDNLGTCPQCGEWLAAMGRGNRRLERVDHNANMESYEWTERERSLIDELN